MTKYFGPVSRLDKLLDSLRSHLFMKEEQEKVFLNHVKDYVEKEFMEGTSIGKRDLDN